MTKLLDNLRDNLRIPCKIKGCTRYSFHKESTGGNGLCYKHYMNSMIKQKGIKDPKSAKYCTGKTTISKSLSDFENAVKRIEK